VPARALSQLIEQRLLTQRIAAKDETAVAAGRAEADLFALQQDDIAHTTLGQPQAPYSARIATTDDGDTARFVPCNNAYGSYGVAVAR
jgi:hypothetical protein